MALRMKAYKDTSETMSDELHKYPGNLKHHNVDAPARREPLLSEYELQNRTAEYGHEVWGPYWNRDRVIAHYEAARAKDAELIQRLVDAIAYSRKHGPAATLGDCHWDIALHNALSDASQLGFKPTDQ